MVALVLLWLGGSGWAVWRYYDGTPKSPDSSGTEDSDTDGGDVAPPEGVVPVPDVVGREGLPAAVNLQQAGLGVAVLREPSIVVPERVVIEQEPVAGAEVAPGTVVELTVSTGPP